MYYRRSKKDAFTAVFSAQPLQSVESYFPVVRGTDPADPILRSHFASRFIHVYLSGCQQQQPLLRGLDGEGFPMVGRLVLTDVRLGRGETKALKAMWASLHTLHLLKVRPEKNSPPLLLRSEITEALKHLRYLMELKVEGCQLGGLDGRFLSVVLNACGNLKEFTCDEGSAFPLSLIGGWADVCGERPAERKTDREVTLKFKELAWGEEEFREPMLRFRSEIEYSLTKTENPFEGEPPQLWIHQLKLAVIWEQKCETGTGAELRRRGQFKALSKKQKKGLSSGWIRPLRVYNARKSEAYSQMALLEDVIAK